MTSALSPRRSALWIWASLRLPILALLVFLFRDGIIDVVERVFDIGRATELVIALLGTPASRALVFVALLFALLSLTTLSTRVLGSASFAPAIAAFALVVGCVGLELLTKRSGLVLATLVTLNLLPTAFEPPRVRRAWRALLLAVPGLGELLFLRRYVECLAESAGPRSLALRLRSPYVGGLLAVLVPAAAGASLLFPDGQLVPLEQAMRLDSRTRQLAMGDFNWIELDPSGRYLFVTGHGVPRIRRYDAFDPERPPVESQVLTGNAQGFAYDTAARELYVYNPRALGVQVLDSQTLELKRVLSLPDLSPGDPWIAIDPRTNTLAIVSEADENNGVPFQVLERESGRVLDAKHDDPGNLILNPGKSLMYVTYFRRTNGVRAYDLALRKFVAYQPTPGRLDRLAFHEAADEVLIAIPMEGRVIRVDASTLRPKGYLNTIFGVRTLAVDAERRLLFCGGLATGALSIVNLKTGSELLRMYVSPWLRTIEVDPKREIAYVSANGGLYALDYRNVL